MKPSDQADSLLKKVTSRTSVSEDSLTEKTKRSGFSIFRPSNSFLNRPVSTFYRAGLRDQCRVFLFPVFFLLGPCAAFYGAKGLSFALAVGILPFLFSLVSEGIKTGIQALQTRRGSRKLLNNIKTGLKRVDFSFYILVLFFIWQALTTIYTSGNTHSPIPVSQFLGLWMIGILGFSFFYSIGQLTEKQCVFAETVFLFSVLFLGVYISIEAIFSFPIAGILKGSENFSRIIRNDMKACSVLILMLPAYGVLAWQRGLWGRISILFLLVSAFLGAHFFTMSAQYLMLFFGGLTFLFGFFFPGKTLKTILCILVLLLFSMPFLASFLPYLPDSFLDKLPTSWVWRIKTWTYVASLIADKPWIGWGVEAGQSPMFNTAVLLRGIPIDLIPKHPHNFILQIWFEGGVVSAGLLLIILIRFLFFLDKPSRFRLVSAASVSLLTIIMIPFLISFGFWSQWFWSAIIIAVGALCLAGKALIRQEKKSKKPL